ncbi:unnamed protein product [Vitrella brassicaformis CCMP3155]|uniref:Uncharacterized protein n=1 Tax=Vitrella brassicaformis (strain CCMP3155) TaxID=1169540 RepID=A0A0G4ECF9_VITBC|nr:unnamed protein product [Vitrella brassicaformis CCMP3155]|eukprot:CEL93214.1 unnamed protein product [Vitrella brassicaformis CCMP3155]
MLPDATRTTPQQEPPPQDDEADDEDIPASSAAALSKTAQKTAEALSFLKERARKRQQGASAEAAKGFLMDGLRPGDDLMPTIMAEVSGRV